MDDVGMVMEKGIGEVMKCVAILIAENTVCVTIADNVAKGLETVTCHIACWQDWLVIVCGHIVFRIGDNLLQQRVENRSGKI